MERAGMSDEPVEVSQVPGRKSYRETACNAALKCAIPCDRIKVI